MQQRLALPWTAMEVAPYAVLTDLCDVQGHALPAADLPSVVHVPAAHVIAAVPLKPATRVILVDPAFFPPVRQRPGSPDLEEIQIHVIATRTQLGFFKPVLGKLHPAVRHVLAAKYTHGQQLPGRQLRLKSMGEMLTGRLGKLVDITLLHRIIDNHKRGRLLTHRILPL